MMLVNKESDLSSNCPKQASWSAALLLGGLAAFSFTGCSQTSPANTRASSGSTATLDRELSQHIKLSEAIFAWGTDMAISDSEGKLGKVEQRHFEWGTTFEYHDAGGALIASAKQKPFSWGVHIDVFDGDGQKIGAVQEKVLQNLFSFTSHYEILDKEGIVIANSEKASFFATSVDVKDTKGNQVAHLSRPSFNLLADSWSVDFKGEFDKRLIIFIPSYKTHADNVRASKSSSISSSKK